MTRLNQESQTSASSPTRSRFGPLGNLALVALLLAGAAAVSYWIQQSEPVAQRESATRRTAALVETIEVTRGTHRPKISVLGVVQPAREIMLSPRVGGAIVEVAEDFRPGGRVTAGTPLVRIDPADYQNAVVMRQSELGQVEAELAIEEGQQRAAELEFRLLGEDIDPANRALVLREPQIQALHNKRQAAQAALAQAQLEFERTQVTAPFDAQIVERFAELGSQVSAGSPLARLVGTERYWVEATVPMNTLRWIPFPEKGQPGAAARVQHRATWEAGTYRTGQVERWIGEVDTTTRLARVIVAVSDPLGTQGQPPLILGTVVQVEIDAQPLDDVVRIDRAYLRQGNTVWVMQEGALRVRSADVVFRDSTHAYLRSGLEPGEAIVTTNLATVVDGLPIRTAAEDEAASEDPSVAKREGEQQP